MPNIIIASRKKDIKINRNARGDGVIKIDSDSADILERILCEANADLSVKELASSMIKYAADDTIVKVEGEEGG